MTAPVAAPTTGLADGEWHRLMRVTPLLRGGFALLALAGFLIAQFRERITEFVIGAPGYPGDPVDWILDHGLAPLGILGALVVIAVFMGLFYVSWRMHTFRVTDELVEVKSGVLNRTHRKARLDRIQGITIQRRLFPRLFGAAALEIEVAGHDGHVRLEYLPGAEADALRREILRRASGAAAPVAADPAAPLDADPAAPHPVAPSLLETRAREFLSPDHDPAGAPPETVVRMHPMRLAGSELLGPRTFWFLVLVAAIIAASFAAQTFLVAFTILPAALGLVSVTVRRVVRSLRYSIAATPDGVRVGFGLLSTSNETLPPGRIHAIGVSQPITWRPFDWWSIRVNRAAHGHSGDRERQLSEVLPVGSRADALKVLRLLVPELRADEVAPLLESGVVHRRGDPRWTTSPRRAAILRWFSWRRNGYALEGPMVLFRRGAVVRELIIVPFARMQSVSARQGPLLRRLRLADLHVHTVHGPVSPRVGALDVRDVDGLFRTLTADAIAAAAADATHRWGRGAEGAA